MDELLSSLASDIRAIELILIVGVSFVGASVHEYIFSSQSSIIAFFKNPNIWISTLVSSILCFIINPWIIDFNPRLLLLPPLLFGLAGMDLVMRLVTLKGSTSIIEYILGFLGIKNNKEDDKYGVPNIDETHPNNDTTDHTHTTEEQEGMSTEDFERFVNLDQIVHTNFDAICALLVEYYINHDKVRFLHGYHTIKMQLENQQRILLSYQFVPIGITLKLSEILKKEIEMETIYHELITRPE